MLKDNIAILEYWDNTNVRLTYLKEQKDPKLEVDLKKMLWSYGKFRDIPIGKKRSIDNNSKFGVIGVYNRRNKKHLETLILDVAEAVRL